MHRLPYCIYSKQHKQFGDFTNEEHVKKTEFTNDDYIKNTMYQIDQSKKVLLKYLK